MEDLLEDVVTSQQSLHSVSRGDIYSGIRLRSPDTFSRFGCLNEAIAAIATSRDKHGGCGPTIRIVLHSIFAKSWLIGCDDMWLLGVVLDITTTSSSYCM